MNLPNKLTLLRIILVPLFVILFYKEMYLYALIVFCVASITDTLDGNIARKYHLITNFGKLMDPLADKILVYAAITLFVEHNWCPAYILIVILAREFLIAGVRLIAASNGNVISADIFGKLKTIFQMIWVIALLVNKSFVFMNEASLLIAQIFMYLSLAFTIISGFNYCIKNKNVFD